MWAISLTKGYSKTATKRNLKKKRTFSLKEYKVYPNHKSYPCFVSCFPASHCHLIFISFTGYQIYPINLLLQSKRKKNLLEIQKYQELLCKGIFRNCCCWTTTFLVRWLIKWFNVPFLHFRNHLCKHNNIYIIWQEIDSSMVWKYTYMYVLYYTYYCCSVSIFRKWWYIKYYTLLPGAFFCCLHSFFLYVRLFVGSFASFSSALFSLHYHLVSYGLF